MTFGRIVSGTSSGASHCGVNDGAAGASAPPQDHVLQCISKCVRPPQGLAPILTPIQIRDDGPFKKTLEEVVVSQYIWPRIVDQGIILIQPILDGVARGQYPPSRRYLR